MPWEPCCLFNHVPVPCQDSMSLSLFLCSGEAAQGTQRQHNSEELGGPGTAHRWCPAHYKLVSRYPPRRKAPLQALGRTRKILGSARAQCQDSSLCCAQERTKYSPKQSFLSPRPTNPSLPPSPSSIPVAAPVLLLHISDRQCGVRLGQGMQPQRSRADLEELPTPSSPGTRA